MDGLVQYKQRIKDFFVECTHPNLKWRTTEPGKKVQRFQADTLYKMEALLECDPKRAFVLCADHHYTTRSVWDPNAKQVARVMEHFATEDGDIYKLRDNTIQWIRKHSIIVFWNKEWRIIIWTRAVDEKCFLVCISNLPVALNVLLIERIARDSSIYLQTYNPWNCQTCRKQVPAHELYCRSCDTARFARCSDLACYEAQMRNATTCWKCKERLESIN